MPSVSTAKMIVSTAMSTMGIDGEGDSLIATVSARQGTAENTEHKIRCRPTDKICEALPSGRKPSKAQIAEGTERHG